MRRRARYVSQVGPSLALHWVILRHFLHDWTVMIAWTVSIVPHMRSSVPPSSCTPFCSGFGDCFETLDLPVHPFATPIHREYSSLAHPVNSVPFSRHDVDNRSLLSHREHICRHGHTRTPRPSSHPRIALASTTLIVIARSNVQRDASTVAV